MFTSLSFLYVFDIYEGHECTLMYKLCVYTNLECKSDSECAFLPSFRGYSKSISNFQQE